MATIAKLQKKTGIRYRFYIKCAGRVLKTKTFRLKRDAVVWAKSLEADQDRMESLGSPGAGMTLANLIDEYMRQYTGKDRSTNGHMAFWSRYLGAKKLTDITAREIRDLLTGYAESRYSPPVDPDKRATRASLPRARPHPSIEKSWPVR